ncbi:MAG: T9SS type A sorting domain-containing protein [Bacteroidales bacterium]|nr:T9SS type A sorting domain-containing protein [Bacteroidales bacterium]
MKNLLLAMALIAIALASYAKGYEGILVTMVDGTTATINFDENPIIKLKPEKLVVQTDIATTEFDRSKVARFNYVGDVTTRVDAVVKNDVKVFNKGGVLLFANLPVNSEIRLFSADGKLLKRDISTDNYVLNITDFSSGIYIVKVNGVSTKIVK